ncbi:O-antigen ligase domain-containing protein [Leptospira biflexa]|uniref:O-antigen ligase family protein n=1 Tax=Leptospira biflexa TaxID=172 RepID=UPI00108376A4|nr:O-antigen ligase family protein [Leptospira biflexa]TGM34388.1 O-antigen ligase domain-containing protein [Leptospira biflexa]TGM39958.1 O-antigen ligase domain-containing protein [Leptospira biflexa]TGM48449.1 O-antigen ligase domain-containing protein [Leptospira biflexa]TGM49085.1 O-antigen ligase domain-containing protein [Leptospira biflexa]
MIGKETFHKISFVFLAFFFALSPISISLSQIFAGLSLFFLFLDQMQKRKLPQIPIALIFWTGLYLSFLLTPLIENQTIQWKKDIVKSEFGDLWMGFLLLHQTYLKDREKKRIHNFVFLGAIILILSGTISLFFPYRLAPFVMDGFRHIEGKRLPHLLANVHGISVYLPIGFQSTHLTYGGLLAVYLPSLWEKSYRLLSKKKRMIQFWKTSLLTLSVSGFGMVLLLLNQSRSIWIGIFLGAILLLQKSKSSIKSILPWVLTGIFFLLMAFLLFYHSNWLFQRAIDDLFAKRSLENQRIWIHKMNYSILKENLVFGIGGGNYENRFIDIAIPIVNEIPALYYDLSITPKSHAHFDVLHDLILGGIFAFLFYLGFLWSITKQIDTTNRKYVFYLGIPIVLFAGSFQCYLLDDEVLLPFMGLLALLPILKFTSKNEFQSKPNESLFQTLFQNLKIETLSFSFGLILFWIFFSLTVTYLWSRTENAELVLHRTRTNQNFPSHLSQLSVNAKSPIPLPVPTKQMYFKLSGCLDQVLNFRKDPSPRLKPIQLEILWDKEVETNLPNRLTVEIRKRESFDQDKEYRLQKESVVKTFAVPLNRKDVQIVVDPREFVTETPAFVDFGFWYEWDSVSPHLPRLRILGNCD